MTSKQFCYWLKGVMDSSGSIEEDVIRENLEKVFLPKPPKFSPPAKPLEILEKLANGY